MNDVEVLSLAIPLWVIVGFVVLAVTMWAAPKGRRPVVAVPVVVFVLITLAAANVGRDGIAKERAAGSGASKDAVVKAHESRCQAALRLVDSGLTDAARRELELAVATRPDEPSNDAEASCQTALGRLAQVGDDGDMTIEVRQDDAAVASDEAAPTPLVEAVQVGAEHVADNFLDYLVGGNEDARKQALTMGPLGWLLLGGVVLLLVAAWVRLCFQWIRRTTVPRVLLASVVEADGESETIAGLCAELRQRLFEHELQAGSTPSSTSLPDDIAGVVEESGVAGSKLASKVLAVLFRLFGSDNNLKVDVTVHQTGDPRKAVVEMADYRSGRTLTVQTITAAGDNDDASSLVIRKVAAIIRNEALARLGNGQPPQAPTPAVQEQSRAVRSRPTSPLLEPSIDRRLKVDVKRHLPVAVALASTHDQQTPPGRLPDVVEVEANRLPDAQAAVERHQGQGSVPKMRTALDGAQPADCLPLLQRPGRLLGHVQAAHVRRAQPAPRVEVVKGSEDGVDRGGLALGHALEEAPVVPYRPVSSHRIAEGITLDGRRCKPRQVLADPGGIGPTGVLVDRSGTQRRRIVGVDGLQFGRQARRPCSPPRPVSRCPRLIGSGFRGLAGAAGSVIGSHDRSLVPVIRVTRSSRQRPIRLGGGQR